MSLPAERATHPVVSRPSRRPPETRIDPRNAPRTQPATPARTTAARPRTSTPPRPTRRARRGSPLPFLILAASIVFGLVVGVVALNAVLAQAAFHVHALQSRVSTLADQHVVLTEQEAGLSSPGRVADWARVHQMVTPADVVILQVDGTTAGRRGASRP